MVFGDYSGSLSMKRIPGSATRGMLADNGNAFAAFFHIDTVFDSLHGEIDILPEIGSYLGIVCSLM